ncbi:MAG TPA: hypothetical protein ENG13_05785, partial [bacterium]|nr:hypothetical protein [bacterium]HEX68553.1 hypothetical protein [bacterium]
MSNLQSGMALIVVLAIMAILSAIAASFAYQMRMEEKASFNYLKASEARSIAISGIMYGVAVIENDREDTLDTLHE